MKLLNVAKNAFIFFFSSGKTQGYITSLPIVGGITASGVFLLFVSVVGLIGAMKHHQVMLFFYMVVLFFIFIIQFSCSCAALTMADNEHDQLVIFGKVIAILLVSFNCM